MKPSDTICANNNAGLLLIRSYHALAVNGTLYYNNRLIAYTIELPWLNNQPGKSCIPEGTYPVVKRWSKRFKWHLHILDVPARSLILIHPANDALKELRGCIAPVTVHNGIGKGLGSRGAMEKVLKQFEAISRSDKKYINIRKEF